MEVRTWGAWCNIPLIRGRAFHSHPCFPQLPRKRVPLSLSCSSSKEENKGFGSPSPLLQKKKIKKKKKNEKGNRGEPHVVVTEGSQDYKNLIRSLDKKASRKPLNIDPEVAARGKVEFVKVESWELEEESSSDFGNLKLKGHTPLGSANDDAPLYEKLVRMLQLLENKGDLSIVRAVPLAPFERWVFGEHRYLQYLVNQLAVHECLEAVISSLNDTKYDANKHDARLACCIFDQKLGLHRSEALKKDIKVLLGLVCATEHSLNLSEPTTQTVAYVKYLFQLGKISNIEGEQQRYLKLLAHIFAIHVAHLTTGMRIGAKAMERLPILLKNKAFNFYENYPQEASNPLKVFISAINRITDFVPLNSDHEKLMEELPKAMIKTSLLLSILATEEMPDSSLQTLS